MKRFRIRDNKGNTHVFQVDDEDVPIVRAHKWRAYRHHTSGNIHIIRWGGSLHRDIMGNPPGKLVDHKDRDTLNNCRSNLRVCNKVQNAANCRPNQRKAGTTSRFKGVSLRANKMKWRAKIVNRDIGYFDTEEEAARAYDAAALERWGEFARTNEMLGLYDPE